VTDAPRPPHAADPALAHRLAGHVQALAGTIGERGIFRPDAYAAARDYIRRELIGAAGPGADVQVQAFASGGQTVTNLEVVRPGTHPTLPCLVVGAHYDTVKGTPGADDNATGVAALVELVRAFAPGPHARTLRFVAFANEEAPFFDGPEHGSLVYARSLKAAGERVHLMLSLEMLGYFTQKPGSQHYPPLMAPFYPDRGDFIGLVSNLGSRARLVDLVAAFKAASAFPVEHLASPEWVPGVSLSDHHSFWREGYRAVMVTDTAFYRNPHYHTATDAPETIDVEGLAAVTAGLSGALAKLAAG
jgi:Zn-dependent M28 family amino/carboxypeptidase